MSNWTKVLGVGCLGLFAYKALGMAKEYGMSVALNSFRDLEDAGYVKYENPEDHTEISLNEALKKWRNK